MRIGLVGSEAAKFTKLGRRRAKHFIAKALSRPSVMEVVSGDCHLGGIDRWAAKIGRELGLIVTEFSPKIKSWEQGYKPRNLKIAKRSDKVYCLSVDKLPKGFIGMEFPLCYHCGTKDHVKSGGCWTMRQAIKMGKKGKLIIIKNY